MSDDPDTTVKIRLNAKVGADSKGRSVWTKPIEPVELELVSTQMLEQLLDAGDEEQTARIRALADTEGGVLARDPTSNELGMVSEDDVAEALRSSGNEADMARDRAGTRPARGDDKSAAADKVSTDEWSLVTTQMLRQMLAGDERTEPEKTGKSDKAEKAKDAKPKGGYNPYDRG